MALQVEATFTALPQIERGCAYAGEGRFEVNEMNEMNGKMGKQGNAEYLQHGNRSVSIMLRFNVGASSQRKVDDVVQNLPLFPIPLKMPFIRSSYALGILIDKSPRTPISSLPTTYTSLEFLSTLTTCFIWPSTPLICSCSSSLALLFLSACS